MGLPRSTLRGALVRGFPCRKIRFVWEIKKIDSWSPNSSPSTHAPAALCLRRISATRPTGRPWRPNGRNWSRVSMSRKSRVSARPATAIPAQPTLPRALHRPSQATARAIPDAPFHVAEASSPSRSREIPSDVLKTLRGSTPNRYGWFVSFTSGVLSSFLSSYILAYLFLAVMDGRSGYLRFA